MRNLFDTLSLLNYRSCMCVCVWPYFLAYIVLACAVLYSTEIPCDSTIYIYIYRQMKYKILTTKELQQIWEKKRNLTLLKFINQNERFIIKIYFGLLMEIALCVISSVLFILFLLQSRLCILAVCQQRLRNIDPRYFAVSPLRERHPVPVHGGCSSEDPPFALIIWNFVLLFSIDDEIEEFLRCVRLRLEQSFVID